MSSSYFSPYRSRTKTRKFLGPKTLRKAYRYLQGFLHLTEEAYKVSIPKVVGVMSCGFLLCLGLSNAAQADNAASAQDEMKAGQSDHR